jgi:hypothetical protein
MARITVLRRKDRGRQMDQENGQYTGSREDWPRDRRGESYRSMYDDSGLCKGCVLDRLSCTVTCNRSK